MPISTPFQAIVTEKGHKAAALFSLTFPALPRAARPHFRVIFFLGIEVISDVMCVSGVRELDSLTCEHLSILFQVLVPI